MMGEQSVHFAEAEAQIVRWLGRCLERNWLANIHPEFFDYPIGSLLELRSGGDWVWCGFEIKNQ